MVLIEKEGIEESKPKVWGNVISHDVLSAWRLCDRIRSSRSQFPTM